MDARRNTPAVPLGHLPEPPPLKPAHLPEIVVEPTTELKEPSQDDLPLGVSHRVFAEAENGVDVISKQTNPNLPKREHWPGRFQFLMSCIGYAVGLGNVWRFPYLCYKNGGGAFLIPYFIMLFAVGIPLFILEAAIGQFTSRGVLACWEFAPFFSGLGIAMVCVSYVAATYYNVIIAWAWYYLFASFAYVDKKLPWMTCPNDFSSELCYHRVPNMKRTECQELNYTVLNTDGFCYDGLMKRGLWNETIANLRGISRRLPAQDYLDYVVLGTVRSSGIDDLGRFNIKLAACLALAWLVTYLCVFKGIKSSGRVSYFTVTLPYVILLIFLIRGLTLDGSAAGIQYFLKPNLGRLRSIRVWKDATVQVFFSLGVSWGAVTCLSSHNNFHHDFVRDTLIIAFANTVASVLAGLVTFCFIGHLATQMNIRIRDVALSSGSLLAFVIFPEAVATLPFPPIWSFLFFLMLICLGLDSLFTQVETVAISVMDLNTGFKERKPYTILGIVVCMYGIGLTMCTDGSAYVIEWLDNYALGWNVLAISLVECTIIAWMYGCWRFSRDIEVMVGGAFCHCLPWRLGSLFCVTCWSFFTPLLLGFVLIFSWASRRVFRYNNYKYPAWSETMGTLLFAGTLLLIFVPGVIKLTKTRGTIIQRLKEVFQPSMYWGPEMGDHRILVSKYVSGFVVDPWLSEQMDRYSTYMVERFGMQSKSQTNGPNRSACSSKISYVSNLEVIDEGEEEEESVPAEPQYAESVV